MAKEWIAIVGSIDPNRTDVKLEHLDRAPQVLRQVGQALAEKGYGIVVYFSKPEFIEAHVVAGYIKSGKATDKSIRVRYSQQVPEPKFQEQQTNSACFDLKVDPNPGWEVSFYRSLYDVDGIVLLGGGQSTLIAGIVATTRRTPILALRAFGGAAADVWQLLNPYECLSLTDDEKGAMAVLNDSEEWARQMVELLGLQKTRLAEAARKQEAFRQQRLHRLTIEGLTGVGLLVLALLLFVSTWDATLGRMLLLGALIAAPALAGTSASIVRSLWEQVVGDTVKPDRPGVVTALLGCAAGIVAGLLYVVAQLTAITPSASGQMPASASRLVPFALLTGFLAGFATDAFFRKMRDRDVGSVEVPAFRAPGQST